MGPLARVEDRCWWDVDMPLDLSGVTEIEFSVRATEPTAIERCSLHFRSGEGWYGGWFTLSGDTWQTIRLPRRAFEAEGDSAGWGSIQGMRLSLWKKESKNTLFMLTGLRGRSDNILVIRNSHAQLAHPEEMSTIDRASKRVGDWLNESGIAVGQLDDSDIAEGLPPGCSIVLLPYNPCPPDTTLDALFQFAADGGRIIAAYCLPDKLAPILGLAGKRYAAADSTAPFSSIGFPDSAGTGLPSAIRQDSWNANIPQLSGARALGFWQNGDDVLGELPAVTVSRHGVYIGHVLTNVDRDRKVQLLLALMAMLQPDEGPALAQALMERAERLFDCEGWEQTRTLIEDAAKAHARELSGIVHLDAVERYRQETASQIEQAAFGELMMRAEATRHLIQDAYFNVNSNRGVTNEFRGLWCHSALGVPGKSWQDTVAAMKASGFNALLPNMLWAGLAYYPSSVVPTASVIDEKGDLLAECLEACHEHGVALHLWKVCWNLSHAPHAFVEKLRSEGRLQQKADGESIAWLCPSDPRNRDLELSAAMEAVKNYAVDGFHYDYIRYPDGESCFCSGCRKRFSQATDIVVTNWPAAVIDGEAGAAFRQWRHKQITSFVAMASSALRSARPGLQISAAVFPRWPSTCDGIGQDWGTWAKEGYVDFLCPMNYVTDGSEAKALAASQLAAVDGLVPIYPGLGPSTKGLPPEQVVRQVDLIRGVGATGFVLFELDQDLLKTHLPALRAGATRE